MPVVTDGEIRCGDEHQVAARASWRTKAWGRPSTCSITSTHTRASKDLSGRSSRSQMRMSSPASLGSRSMPRALWPAFAAASALLPTRSPQSSTVWPSTSVEAGSYQPICSGSRPRSTCSSPHSFADLVLAAVADERPSRFLGDVAPQLNTIYLTPFGFNPVPRRTHPEGFPYHQPPAGVRPRTTNAVTGRITPA